MSLIYFDVSIKFSQIWNHAELLEGVPKEAVLIQTDSWRAERANGNDLGKFPPVGRSWKHWWIYDSDENQAK